MNFPKSNQSVRPGGGLGGSGQRARAAAQALAHLRMHSRAWVKTCGAMPCSCCRIRHCSSVTDMAVRSLALLQLVNRTPLRRRQTCPQENEPRLEDDSAEGDAPHGTEAPRAQRGGHSSPPRPGHSLCTAPRDGERHCQGTSALRLPWAPAPTGAPSQPGPSLSKVTQFVPFRLVSSN